MDEKISEIEQKIISLQTQLKQVKASEAKRKREEQRMKAELLGKRLLPLLKKDAALAATVLAALDDNVKVAKERKILGLGAWEIHLEIKKAASKWQAGFNL